MSDLTPAQSARLEEIIQATHPSLLSPEKREALINPRVLEMARNYERMSGNAVLPTTKAKSAQQRLQDYAAASPELERVLTNCGRLEAPMSPELKRILGNTRPSLLSPADQQSLMLPRVIEIMSNYQRASGYAVLPIDRAQASVERHEVVQSWPKL